MRLVALLVLAAVATQVRLKPDTTFVAVVSGFSRTDQAGPTGPALQFDAALAVAKDLPRLHSLLVSRRGELMLERYYNGARAVRPANIKSASKSIISALVGIAIE